MTGPNTVRTEYRSAEWASLRADGWITLYVVDGIAVMLAPPFHK